MNLLEHCAESKVAAIALLITVKEICRDHGVDPHGENLKAIAEAARIQRPQVYPKIKQLKELMAEIEVNGVGRPPRSDRQGAIAHVEPNTETALELSLRVSEFARKNPGSLRDDHASGRATYTDSYIRMLLDEFDKWPASKETFCRAVKIGTSTLDRWLVKDKEDPFTAEPRPAFSSLTWPAEPNELVKAIAQESCDWAGPIDQAFFKHAAAKFNVKQAAVIKILRICGRISARERPMRYRGDTQRGTPGSIIVTDGKEVKIHLADGRILKVNWQGTVDQATACHVATVVTPTESAEGVKQAYDEASEFLGRAPDGLVHDNKPIHNDKKLRKHIKEKTEMIPATPNTPTNKAVIEGEFGKHAQHVGDLHLDLSTEESTILSATHEFIRGYTAGINHAPREEFKGKSRMQVLRESRPDPKKDIELITKLQAGRERRKFFIDPQPWMLVSRALLDEAYQRFGFAETDPRGTRRAWIAQYNEPDAVRWAISIFGVKWEKGVVKKTRYACRYLTKIINNCQLSLDLEREEHWLVDYAEKEKQCWLTGLNATYAALVAERSSDSEGLMKDLVECAIHGSIMIEKAYWERKLNEALTANPEHTPAVLAHVRRYYEGDADDRRRLHARIVSWSYGFERIVRSE